MKRAVNGVDTTHHAKRRIVDFLPAGKASRTADQDHVRCPAGVVLSLNFLWLVHQQRIFIQIRALVVALNQVVRQLLHVPVAAGARHHGWHAV